MLIAHTPSLAATGRPRRHGGVLAALVALLLAGCPGPTQQQPAGDGQATIDDGGTTTSGSTERADAATPATVQVDTRSIDTGEEDTATENAATDADPAGQSAAETKAGGTARVIGELPDSAKSRILLLEPRGPLVIELAVFFDGQPFREARDNFLDEALRRTDTDESGETSWDELLNSPEIEYGLFGIPPVPDDDMAREEAVKRLDTENPGVVDRDELGRLLASGAPNGPLRFESVELYRNDPRYDSLVLKLLDRDRDGAVSGQEMEGASTQLFRQDADDDELLFLADFAADVGRDAARAMAGSQRRSGPRLSVVLDTDTNWSSTLFLLEEYYGIEFKLIAESFPRSPKLFARLDSNQDDRLTPDELSALLSIGPHVSFVARMGRDPDSEDSPTPIIVATIAPELGDAEALVTVSDSRATVRLSEGELQFIVDRPPDSDETALAQARMEALDTDDNNYLDSKELPDGVAAGLAPFAVLDENDDEQVSVDEIASIMRLRRIATQSQLAVTVGDAEDAMFVALDQNSDGRLGSREVHGAAEQLRALDQDGDAGVSAAELPRGISVRITRGRAGRFPGQPPTAGPRAASTADDGSAWFSAMDRNGDGEISRREFLGSTDQFDQADADGNGYLTAAEVAPTALP